MNKKDQKLQRIHSRYCRYSDTCEKEHNCKEGDFCSAYMPRFDILNEGKDDFAHDDRTDEFEQRLRGE